jgi:hypothetical protein
MLPCDYLSRIDHLNRRNLKKCAYPRTDPIYPTFAGFFHLFIALLVDDCLPPFQAVFGGDKADGVIGGSSIRSNQELFSIFLRLIFGRDFPGQAAWAF